MPRAWPYQVFVCCVNDEQDAAQCRTGLRTLVAEAGGLPGRSLCTRCLPEGSWCSFLDDDVCHIHKPDYLSLHDLVMLAFLTALQRRVHLWGLNTSSCPAPSAL